MPISDKKITTFAKDVSDLADKPNQGGMSAAQVKAQFDAAPNELRVTLNGLIDILLGTTSGDSGAKNIGAETISGVNGATVHDQLVDLKTQLNNAVVGQIPDGSISTDKYADASVTSTKLASGATEGNLGFTPVNKAGDTMSGNLTVPALVAAGLTGATAASRYVGATISGAPNVGAFAKGDFVFDQSGAIWLCTTSGTPGTWKQLGLPTTEKIAEVTLASASASITFSSIPQNYKELLVIVSARTDNATQALSSLMMQCNSAALTFANYESTGGNNPVGSTGRIANIPTSFSTNPSTDFASALIRIPNYTKTDRAKHCLSQYSSIEGANYRVGQAVGIFNAANAINSLSFLAGAGNFVTGSVATLYGIR